MKLLYDDQYAPMTSRIGFLAAEHSRVVDTYLNWMRGLNRKLRIDTVAGPLKGALEKLPPLTTRERRRFLFAPTASQWVAYFDNGRLGTDAPTVMAHMARLLSCRSISILAISKERELRRATGRRHEAAIFELFEPHDTDWLNQGRSIAMMNDGKWIFELGGEQQPFEEPENYSKRKIQERFTLEMLDRYLRALGIRAFDEAFYFPSGTTGTFLEKKSTPVAGMKEVALEEALIWKK